MLSIAQKRGCNRGRRSGFLVTKFAASGRQQLLVLFLQAPGVEFVGSCEYLKMHGHGIKSTSDGYVFVQNCTCRNQHSCRRFDFHPGGSVRWILGPCRSASCVTASGFVWKWTKTCLIPLDNHHFSGKLQQIQCLALLRGLNSWHFHSQRTQGLWWRIA